MKKLGHEPDQPMNELEKLRKSPQLNQLITDNTHDPINQLPGQPQVKNTDQQLAESQLKASEESSLRTNSPWYRYIMNTTAFHMLLN